MESFSLRRIALAAAVVFLGIYAAAYIDLTLRARSAHQEGEKYLAWDRDPSLKAAYFDAVLAATQARLRRERTSARLTEAEFTERLELARFERDYRVSESSLKYAFIWFQTAVELFSPPESKWVILSRAKMISTRELWKKELDAQKIPYQDYMLE